MRAEERLCILERCWLLYVQDLMGFAIVSSDDGEIEERPGQFDKSEIWQYAPSSKF